MLELGIHFNWGLYPGARHIQNADFLKRFTFGNCMGTFPCLHRYFTSVIGFQVICVLHMYKMDVAGVRNYLKENLMSMIEVHAEVG